MPFELSRRAAVFLVVLAALAHIALGAVFFTRASATFDEPVHLATGYAAVSGGGLILNSLDHPPLAEMVNGFPLLFSRPQSFRHHPDYAETRKYHFADLFLYQNRVPWRDLLMPARAFGLFVWTAVVFPVLGWWAWRLAGPTAAAAAAWLYALTPPVYVNASLVTTDAGSTAFFFAAFALLSKAAEGERPLRWAAASGAAAGLAMASKFNMAALPPLLAAFLAVAAWRKPGLRRHVPAMALAAAAAALLALAVVYQGALGLYVQGLLATAKRTGAGRTAFFFGRHSTEGFWAYFPVLLAFKTPLPLLALSLGGLGWAVARVRRENAWLWVAGPLAAYFAAALAVKLQIGYRHLLPMLPFLALLAGCAAAALLKSRAGAALVAGLLLWQGVTGVRAAPAALSWFNVLAGGAEGGGQAFSDSNVDWGQALGELSAWLKKDGDAAVYLSYFGTADPAAEGLRYHPVAMGSEGYVRRAPTASPLQGGKLYFAVSLTHLRATYFRDKTVYDWLRDVPPKAVLGGALFLYDFSEDAKAREDLAHLMELDGQAQEAARLRAWKKPRA